MSQLFVSGKVFGDCMTDLIVNEFVGVPKKSSQTGEEST